MSISDRFIDLLPGFSKFIKRLSVLLILLVLLIGFMLYGAVHIYVKVAGNHRETHPFYSTEPVTFSYIK